MKLDEINNTLPPKALRLKIEAKLDKMKELELEHNTPVKWISMKRTRS